MTAERDAQIVSLMPLVRSIAAGFQRRYGVGFIEWDDLVADGHVGAILAVDKFDPQQGDNLEAFAQRRIRGEMIDGLRRRVGRLDDREQSPKAHANAQSLDEPLPSGITRGDLLAGDGDAVATVTDTIAVHQVLDRLRPEWSGVLRDYYMDGLTLQEAGARRGRSESLMCKLMQRATVEAYRVLVA